MISEILKESTKPLHDQVEAKFNSHRIFDGTFTLEDYGNLINYNYLFLLYFENPVFSFISEQNAKALNLSERRKLALIENDMEALHLTKDTACTSVAIKNQAEAFGILYVMEGSTLGGNMIAKQLSKHPDFKEITFGYFRCYGERTGSYWKNFKEVMDREITLEFQEDCIAGANRAYGFLLGLPE